MGLFFPVALRPNTGHGLLIHEFFKITHNDASESVGLPGHVISSSQRPLPDNTQHSQQTNIHDPGGIRNHEVSKRATADLSLRPRGYWDRRIKGHYLLQIRYEDAE